MKKSGLVILTVVVALLIISFIKFNISMLAGSTVWSTFIEGLITFRIPLLTGFVILLVLIFLNTDNSDHNDHHDDHTGGKRRLQPVRVKSNYRNDW